MPLEPDPTAVGAGPRTHRSPRWYHKAGRVVISAFCMALGIFLVIAPWIDAWQQSYLPSLGPQWRSIWIDTYFRGAVSGLGVVDIYIAIQEISAVRAPHDTVHKLEAD
jgi:hypothetical protein